MLKLMLQAIEEELNKLHQSTGDVMEDCEYEKMVQGVLESVSSRFEELKEIKVKKVVCDYCDCELEFKDEIDPFGNITIIAHLCWNCSKWESNHEMSRI